MGVLIVVLSMVLVGELLRRAFFAGPSGTHLETPALHAIEPGLPDGARIADLIATQDHVVIHAILPDGRARLFVLDPEAAARAAIERDASPTPGSPDPVEVPLAQ